MCTKLQLLLRLLFSGTLCIGLVACALSFAYGVACACGIVCCISVFIWIVLLQYLILYTSDLIIN